MRKVTIEDAETMVVALKQEIARSEDSRYDHRLHGLLLVCQGMTIVAVSRYLGQARRTVQYWVDRFRAKGLAGLREQSRSGRPSQLSTRQQAAIAHDLRQSPRELGYEQNGWDGKLLSHHLATRYGVVLQVRQCQRLFRQLRFRLRKPRSLIAHADPAAQAAFKKTPALPPSSPS
jgi:transposase